MQYIDLFTSTVTTSVFSSTYTMAASNREQDSNRLVQEYLDTITAAAVEELLSPNGQPSVTLKRRPKSALFFINPGNGALETDTQETFTTYRWPGKDAYEAWKFSMRSGSISCNATNPIIAITVRILAAISEAVQAKLVISKRSVG